MHDKINMQMRQVVIPSMAPEVLVLINANASLEYGIGTTPTQY
jgi:hypothetical protein